MQITKSIAWQLSVLAYASWTESADTLKAVKAEKNDGSKDWAEFHKCRLEDARQIHDTAKRLSDQSIAIWQALESD